MNNFYYNQYNSAQAEVLAEQEKSKDFLKRIEPFKTAKSLEEARDLSAKILPAKEGLTNFCIGNITCTIVNDKDFLRITIDSPEEYKCYDFS